MGSDKAPPIDGFNSYFFKRTWNLVGRELVEAVKEFFLYGRLLKQINAATLTIIPKTPNPEGLTDYQPIACCTVLYKVITEVIAGRFLSRIVSHVQSTFVLGRRITYNILLAHVLVRNYDRSRGVPCYAMKIDLRKAYDSVKWDFLEEIMLGMHFPLRFIGWVMKCII